MKMLQRLDASTYLAAFQHRTIFTKEVSIFRGMEDLLKTISYLRERAQEHQSACDDPGCRYLTHHSSGPRS